MKASIVFIDLGVKQLSSLIFNLQRFSTRRYHKYCTKNFTNLDTIAIDVSKGPQVCLHLKPIISTPQALLTELNGLAHVVPLCLACMGL